VFYPRPTFCVTVPYCFSTFPCSAEVRRQVPLLPESDCGTYFLMMGRSLELHWLTLISYSRGVNELSFQVTKRVKCKYYVYNALHSSLHCTYFCTKQTHHKPPMFFPVSSAERCRPCCHCIGSLHHYLESFPIYLKSRKNLANPLQVVRRL
jgi:hypothetical protein